MWILIGGIGLVGSIWGFKKVAHRKNGAIFLTIGLSFIVIAIVSFVIVSEVATTEISEINRYEVVPQDVGMETYNRIRDGKMNYYDLQVNNSKKSLNMYRKYPVIESPEYDKMTIVEYSKMSNFARCYCWPVHIKEYKVYIPVDSR